MHLRALAVAAVMTAAVACAARGGGLELVVADVGGARILHAERVAPGARFVLAYVHSSEHVPVRGTFEVGADGRLTVVETAFAGFGPGLPELREGDRWTSEGGMFVHIPEPHPMDELTVRVAPTTRHTLRLPSGHTLDLSATMGPGGAIRLAVRPVRPR
ncbi:MAG TPA: DUF1850 domain-containing protein [Candidatus Limnocylindria bacterium]|nr:DUF1850 domain-containing protein [Candidatus Limnocylindria bacterium]